MQQTVTWISPQFSPSHLANETDGLYFAEDVRRYWKFTTPFSVKFCLKETLPYIIKGQKVVLSPGVLLPTNNGTEMECLPCEPGVRAVFVFFTKKLLDETLRCREKSAAALLDDPAAPVRSIHFFENKIHHPNPLAQRLEQLAGQMQSSGVSDFELQPDVFFDLAERLFDLQNETLRRADSIHAQNPVTRRELLRRLLLARDFLLDRWDAPMTLNDAAKAACLSPYHFHRSFREAFGEPPMRWFRQRKLEKARELLRSGQCNVSDAAYRSGFSDVAAFSKAYKKVMGQNPSEVAF